MVSSSHRAVACILFLVAAALNAHAQKDQTASISGKVTVKNKGVALIIVAAVDPDHCDAEQRSSNRAMTDVDGNYRIDNVPPGNYLVYPIVPAPAAPALVVAGGQRLAITAGETIRDINFAMVHGGAITGRITDADGQPLRETVRVVPVEPESDCERHNFASFHTDDRGIYQALDLRPGKYKVSVGQPLLRQIPLPIHVRKIFRQTFYPSVTEPEKATILEVTESSEIKDIDIVASAASTFRLTGRIIDVETGRPLPNVRLGVQQSNFSASSGSFSSDSNGEFKLEDATPGRYKLFIIPHSDWRADPLTVDVIDKDLTGLEIKATRGASLSGVVVVENSDNKVVALNDLLVFATVPNFYTPDYTPINPIQVNPDGSFKIAGLTAGMIRLHLRQRYHSPLSSLEIASVEQNGVRQSGDINLKDGEQVTGLRIVAKALELTGAIRGQIKFENGEPSPAARIIVSINRLNESLSKSRPEVMSSPPEVDARGRFLIERLAPGTYELTVMMGPPGAQALDDVARQQVTVTKNGVTEVTLTVNLKP